MVELGQILRRVGVTAVYVTHDQTEAYALADQIVVMNQGQIEQVASSEQLYARPATPFVARFLGFGNVVAGLVVVDGVVETEFGRFWMEEARKGVVSLLLKPTAFAVMGVAESAEVNRVEGMVTAVSFRGRYFQVTILHQSSQQSLPVELPHRVQVGDVLNLHVRSSGTILLESPNRLL